MCYPYNLAAWRIRNHIRDDKGDLWTRVANYHSRTPVHNARYRALIMAKGARWEAWLSSRYNTYSVNGIPVSGGAPAARSASIPLTITAADATGGGQLAAQPAIVQPQGSADASAGYVASILAAAFNARITDTWRALEANYGAANSFHKYGQAVDFVPRAGLHTITREQIRAVMAQHGIRVAELLGPGDRGHADHWHLAFYTGDQTRPLDRAQIVVARAERGVGGLTSAAVQPMASYEAAPAPQARVMAAERRAYFRCGEFPARHAASFAYRSHGGPAIYSAHNHRQQLKRRRARRSIRQAGVGADPHPGQLLNEPVSKVRNGFRAFGPQGGNVFLFETPIVLADVAQGAPNAMLLIAVDRATEIPANDLFHSRIVIAVAI